ncbi:phage terminase large subunit [Pseudomonas sp. PDM21]|uniref:phage terminase large subunit n=1 Tax=Pseudomonas sp. PDM21 TaxID=2769257 RepID=UPI00177FD411|nr:phage terminase large subunit [Pseudomonas sp. PDM21]MBD9674956.1 phage terminase large subunit [Pseudomonas sp. PDM21]
MTPEDRQAAAKELQRQKVEDYERKLFAARRLLKVKACKDSLLDFTRMSMPDPEAPDDPDRSRYETHRVHEFIAGELEAVERGECLRLILCVQPRVGKSELVSRKFGPWAVGRNPYRQVVTASYADDLALDFGREVRWLMKSAFYHQVFPGVALRKGNASSDRIQTMAGGVQNFTGVGGGLTGKGADFLLIDDPIKDAEEAKSKTIRDRTWNWFIQVAMTRVMGIGGAVVICMTRWHEDDLVGRLTNPRNPYYNAEEAAKWRVVNIPAFAEANDPLGREPGEILWPERTPRAFLESMRKLDPAAFAALFMGRPAPPEGNLFKRAHIRPYQAHELPKHLRLYAASDHAISEAAKRDPTCMGVVGVDKDDVIWLLPDLVWRQMASDTQVEAMLDLMERHRPLLWTAERGHISLSIGPFLRKRMREEKVFVTIDERVPSKDKPTRAQAIAGRMAMGMVRFPAFAPWYADAVDQLLAFPNATHDDFVDFISLIGLSLDTLHKADTSKPADRAPPTGSIPWILQSAARIKARQAVNDESRYLS